MPLKASVGGSTVIAPDLTDEEWSGLLQQHRSGLAVTMCCCGAPGHLRTSANGVRHFYHAAASACGYAEESAEHLAIKEQVYRACRAAGWEAAVESAAQDRSWVADVLATRGDRRVAFEIQISPITPALLEERDRKYRDAGIEVYWLLDGFFGKPRDFTGWFWPWLCDEIGPVEQIPYLDPGFLATGPENHLFIPRGIRSIGLNTTSRTVFSTSNPSIPVPVWVREVLNGNYPKYLLETSAVLHRRRRLAGMAAPSLVQFRHFYQAIVRDRIYRKRADSLHRSRQRSRSAAEAGDRQKALGTIASEIVWLENEYRRFLAESSGLFVWQQFPGKDVAQPVFRPESEQKVKTLQECAGTLARWEESFLRAADRLER